MYLGFSILGCKLHVSCLHLIVVLSPPFLFESSSEVREEVQQLFT